MWALLSPFVNHPRLDASLFLDQSAKGGWPEIAKEKRMNIEIHHCVR